MRIFLTRLTFDGSNPINRDCKFHSDIQFLVSALSTVSQAICAAKCLNVCSKAFHLVAIVKVIASNWIGVKRAKYCPRQKQWQRKSVSIAKQSSTWKKIYRKKNKAKKIVLSSIRFHFLHHLIIFLFLVCHIPRVFHYLRKIGFYSLLWCRYVVCIIFLSFARHSVHPEKFCIIFVIFVEIKHTTDRMKSKFHFLLFSLPATVLSVATCFLFWLCFLCVAVQKKNDSGEHWNGNS